MNKNTKIVSKKIAYWASVTILGIVVGVSLQFAKAWSEPTASAPAGNVGAPINTTGVAQVKNGPLGVSGVFSAYSNLNVGGQIQTSGSGIRFSDGSVQTRAAGGSSNFYTKTGDNTGSLICDGTDKVISCGGDASTSTDPNVNNSGTARRALLWVKPNSSNNGCECARTDPNENGRVDYMCRKIWAICAR